MITARHLVDDVREIASSGGNPNEFRISDEQIMYWIEEVRSMLISQAIAKKDDINDSWIQYISCLDLEQADISECCDLPSGCVLLRTKKKIPPTIDTWTDNSIRSVHTVAGNIIPKTNIMQSKYLKYSKYVGNSSAWYLKNSYLYIINEVFLDKIEVAGLFESPSDLEDFTNCEGASCFSLDSPYPISLSLATQITDIIIKTKVAPFMMFPKDDSNNATDSRIDPKQTN